MDELSSLLKESCSVNEKKVIKIKKPQSTYTQYRTKILKEKETKNDEEVLLAAKNKSKWLLMKITNFREKMTDTERDQPENTVEGILKQIEINTVIRVVFRKDTSKQNMEELIQIDWLKQEKYPDIYSLDKDVGGLVFHKNNLCKITKENPRPKSECSKTLDVYIPSTNTYGVLKRTGQAGGSQDNQCADAEYFIPQMVGYLKNTPTATENFVFYLDGPFYTSKIIDPLNAMIPVELKERIVITNCESFKLTVGAKEVKEAKEAKEVKEAKEAKEANEANEAKDQSYETKEQNKIVYTSSYIYNLH